MTKQEILNQIKDLIGQDEYAKIRKSIFKPRSAFMAHRGIDSWELWLYGHNTRLSGGVLTQEDWESDSMGANHEYAKLLIDTICPDTL